MFPHKATGTGGKGKPVPVAEGFDKVLLVPSPVLFHIIGVSMRHFSGCPASLAAICDHVTRFDEWHMSRSDILPRGTLTRSVPSLSCCSFHDACDTEVVTGAGVAFSS